MYAYMCVYIYIYIYAHIYTCACILYTDICKGAGLPTLHVPGQTLAAIIDFGCETPNSKGFIHIYIYRERERERYIYIYIYIYICICIGVYIYIYICCSKRTPPHKVRAWKIHV